MTQKFTLALITILAALRVTAQTFTQGDVTVTLMPSASHDSTMCASTGQLFYTITIQNSFIGDSVKVVDPSWGMVLYAEGNTTGQNPWQVFAPVFPQMPIVSDLDIIGNMALFYTSETKVISGPDTVYNIVNAFTWPVTDPCLTDTFSGRVYADLDNNCNYGNNDIPLTSIVVTAMPTYTQGNVFIAGNPGYSDPTGRYTTKVIKSWLSSVDASLPNQYQFIFPTSSCSPTSYHITSLPQNNIDFALQCSGNIDLQAFGGAPAFVRPLIPFYLHAGASNVGCNIASGQLRLVLDPRVTYSAANSYNLPASISGDTLIWNFSNLSSLANPQYWNDFISSVHLTPSNSVGIGDSLCFEIFTDVPANDVNIYNNYLSFCIRVVNSFDPNIKEVSPKGEGAAGNIPANTPELTYTIHFQNTGNAPAIHVIVYDTLDADLQPNVMQIVGSSHTMQAEWISPTIVRFSFYNINLPDSSSNQAGSQGQVTFKVKPKAGLNIGTQITNKASIYFDSNAPIVTNTVLNTIAEPLAVVNETPAVKLQVFPNPTDGTVNVVAENAGTDAMVRILNATGQLISTTPLTGASMQLNLTALPAGLYVVELQTKAGSTHTRLMKTGL